MVRNPKMDEERSKKKEESSEDESVSSEDSSEDDSTGDEEDEEAHDKEDDLSGNETADKNDNTYDSIPQELSDSIPDNVSSNLPKAFPAEVPLGTENPLAAPSAFSSLAPTTVAPPDMAPAIAVPPGTAQPPFVPPGVTPTIATPIGMAAPTTESPGMAQLPVAPQDMAPPIAAPPGMAQPPVVTPGVAQPPVAPPGMAQPPAVPSGVTPPIATPLGMATPTAAPPGVAQLPVASQDMAPPIAAPPVIAQPPAATPGVAPPITVPLGMAAPTVAPPGMAQPPVAPQGMAPTAAPPVMAPSTVAPPFMAPQTGAPPVAATQPAKSKNMFGGLFKKKAKPTPTAVNPQTALPPPPPLQPSSVPQGNVPPPVPPQTYPAPPPRQMPHQANQRLAPIPRVQPYGPPPPTPPKVQLYEPPPPQQYRPPPPQVPVSEPLTPGLVPMPTPPVPRKTSQPSPPEPAQPEPLPVQALERVPGTSPGGDTPPLIYDPQSSVKKPAKGKPSPSEHPEQSEYPPPGSVRSAQPPPGTDISTQPPPGGIAPPPSKEAPQSQRQVSRPPGGAPEAPRDGATTPLSMASVTSQLSTAGPIGFGIGYMDFIPEPRDKFDVLMSRADGWLRGSTTFKAISFETLNVPLSNEGNVSTDEPLYDVGGDRQYSCVLRMWVKPKTLYDDPAAQRIGYCHLFPHWHQESKRKGKKARMPSCETVDGTLDRCNADFAGSKPLRGHIGTVPFAATHCALRKHLGLGTRIGSVLNMETISHLHAFHQSGTPIHLDPEACTWTDNRKQDVNLLSVIRIYYVIGLDVAQEKIGVQDFVPECTEGKDMTTLETASLVVEAAAGWAKERPWLRVTNIQTIRKIGDDADDHLNTRKMLHRRRSGYPVFYSRFVRMYYTELVDPKDPQGMGLSALQYKDFVPAVQLPSHGKGKKMKVKRIEKTGETMQKLVAWHCLSGHDVVCVETIPLGGKGSLTFDPEENFTWETGHDSADYQLFSFRIFTDASRETDQDSDESVKGSVRGSVKGSVKGSPNGSIASRDYAAWPYGCDQNGFTVPPNTFHSDSQQMVH